MQASLAAELARLENMAFEQTTQAIEQGRFKDSYQALATLRTRLSVSQAAVRKRASQLMPATTQALSPATTQSASEKLMSR